MCSKVHLAVNFGPYATFEDLDKKLQDIMEAHQGNFRYKINF